MALWRPAGRIVPVWVGACGAKLFCVQNLRRFACAAYSTLLQLGLPIVSLALCCKDRSLELRGCNTYCYSQQGALTSRPGHRNAQAGSCLDNMRQHQPCCNHTSIASWREGNSSSRVSSPGPLKPHSTHSTGFALCRRPRGKCTTGVPRSS